MIEFYKRSYFFFRLRLEWARRGGGGGRVAWSGEEMRLLKFQPGLSAPSGGEIRKGPSYLDRQNLGLVLTYRNVHDRSTLCTHSRRGFDNNL